MTLSLQHQRQTFTAIQNHRRRLVPLQVTSLQAGVMLYLQRHPDAKMKDTGAALSVQLEQKGLCTKQELHDIIAYSYCSPSLEPRISPHLVRAPLLPLLLKTPSKLTSSTSTRLPVRNSKPSQVSVMPILSKSSMDVRISEKMSWCRSRFLHERPMSKSNTRSWRSRNEAL